MSKRQISREPRVPVARVLVCGGRTYEDAKFFRYKLERILIDVIPFDARLIIISGMQRGADIMAKRYANNADFNGVIEYWGYPAKWDKYGPRAGPIRNRLMADDGRPHLVIAFPGRWGTMDMISIAAHRRIRTILVKSGDLSHDYGGRMSHSDIGFSDDVAGALRGTHGTEQDYEAGFEKEP